MSLLLQMESWLAVDPNRWTLLSGQRFISAERTASRASYMAPQILHTQAKLIN